MWASKIYRSIRDAEIPSIDSLSLRDKILNLQYENWILDKAIREKSLKMFT